MSDNHSLAQLSIVGQNATNFLQGYVSCDLSESDERTAIPMAIPDIKGRVLASGWVHGTENELHLTIHPSLTDTIRDHLKPYLMFSKCNMVESELDWYLASCVEISGVSLKLMPFELTLTLREEEHVDLDQFQIEHQFVLIAEATTRQFLPQMLNLTHHGAVSFSKGCYLGQEVISRAEHRGRVKRGLLRINDLPTDATVGSDVEINTGRKGKVVAIHEHEALVVATLKQTQPSGVELDTVS